jgi:hypothetical protein
MPADLYRDASLGIRARLGELESRIREREAEVTDAFWASLDPDVRERLRTMRPLVAKSHATWSLEDLARAEGRLAAYLDELETLIARLPAIEAEWQEMPESVGDPPPPRESGVLHLPSEDERDTLRRAFIAVVRERDRDAVVEGARSGSGRSLLARFRHQDAPYALRATAYTNGSGQIAEVAMWLVTSVPRATPRLVVRHESLVMAFGKALGIKHEVDVGDPSFDGLFLVEGGKEAALRLLSKNVRGQLMALARFDVPTLEIDPPSRTASVRWRFEPQAKALDCAVRVLASIRETPPVVRFRV